MGGLPTDLKPDLLKRLDVRGMGTLLADGRWQGAMRPAFFDRLAEHTIAQHQDHKPLGSWPAPNEWHGLAAEADAMRDLCPHAPLLANLWAGSTRVASGAVTEWCARYGARLPYAMPYLTGSRLLRSVDRPPEFLAQTLSPTRGAVLMSAEGNVRAPSALQGWQVMPSQDCFNCEAVDSPLPGRPPKPSVVVDDRNRCGIFDPTRNDVQRLPDAFAGSRLAAVSGNGRYVVATHRGNGRLMLHDREQGRTTELHFLRTTNEYIIPAQLSVDSEGCVFVSTGENGVQFQPGGEVRQVVLASHHSNYRLSPDERFIVSNDRTSTNLRLEDRRSGAIKTLRHPAALDYPIAPKRILALAFSPGLAWAATTCSDGTLSLYDLLGREHDAALDPALQVRLQVQHTAYSVQNAVPWFDDDAGAVNVGYTEQRTDNRALLGGMQVMRLPLV